MMMTLTKIARAHLGLATLETRNGDSMDFREHAVWSIRAALKAAYKAGTAAALLGFADSEEE